MACKIFVPQDEVGIHDGEGAIAAPYRPLNRPTSPLLADAGFRAFVDWALEIAFNRFNAKKRYGLGVAFIYALKFHFGGLNRRNDNSLSNN